MAVGGSATGGGPKAYIGGATVQLTNLISSVTSTGLSGWTMNSNYNYGTMHPDQPNGYTYITVKSDSTVTGTYACYQLFSTISGNTSNTRQVIYCQAKIRGNTNNTGSPRVYLRYYKNGDSTVYYKDFTPIEGESTNLNDGNWHTVYAGQHTYSNSSGEYFDYDRIAFGINPTNTANDSMDIKDVMIVNLTEGFGHDQEPSNSWCHDNLTYFEGTTKIFDTYHSNATSVANLIKEIYVGINNTARKVKKGYIGVGGMARLWYSAKEGVYYYGTATALSTSKYIHQSASTGKYAIFAGGWNGSPVTSANAYDNTLVRSVLNSLPVAKYSGAGASIGGYALFAGGRKDSSTRVATTYAYSNSLVLSTPTALSSSARDDLAGASVGNYALFAGGETYSGVANGVDAYNTSLVLSTPTALSTARTQLAGASVGDYALFAGGYISASSKSAVVNAYNTSLTRSTPTALSTARYSLAGASVTGYALFGGGRTATATYSAVVNAYNTSLTRSTPTALPTAAYDLASASHTNYAIFAGGENSSDVANVVVYNKTLTVSRPDDLSIARFGLRGATVGKYFLIAGGRSGSSYRSTVDVYEVF